MRILHFSDVHIGVENYGRPATEADLEALPDSFAPGMDRRLYLGLSTRLLDFLAAFDELVAFAVRENVDLVMFSGDAYKSRDPSQTHQREFARRVSSLASQGIPVFLLVGNHDLPHARSSATSLEIFPTLIVPHVTVAEQLETHLIQTRSGPLQVVALPWPRWRNLLSRDQHRGKSVAELKAHVEAEITRRLLREVERLDPAVPAVLSAHVSVLGATYGSERSMALGRDHVLQYGNVALPALDYVGLGHIHKHQVLGDWPPVVYSGSLQAVDFGEENEDKGFCLVEIDPTMPNGRRARWEFVPVPSRTFVTIDVDVLPDGRRAHQRRPSGDRTDPRGRRDRPAARPHPRGACAPPRRPAHPRGPEACSRRRRLRQGGCPRAPPQAGQRSFRPPAGGGPGMVPGQPSEPGPGDPPARPREGRGPHPGGAWPGVAPRLTASERPPYNPPDEAAPLGFDAAAKNRAPRLVGVPGRVGASGSRGALGGMGAPVGPFRHDDRSKRRPPQSDPATLRPL